MVDYSLIKTQIDGLSSSGFRLSLDDYGSGYSNLTRVKRYPFENIKIDMEIVWDYFNARDHLLPTLIHAFKEMNFTITAEGIENREMADEFRRIGCDYLQVSTGIVWEDPTLAEHEAPYNLICEMGIRFHEHFRGRVPVSCVNSIFTPEQIKYLIENELVDTVDLGRAILADPAICEAALDGAPYVKCFDCPRCQFGPGMVHKCPAEMRRMQ